MRIIFIAPRFHTNLYHQVLALKNAGHTIKFLALYKGFAEKHENVDFEELGYSKIYLVIDRVYSILKRNHLKSFLELKLGMPNMKKFKKIVKSFEPELIIVKGYQDILSFRVIRFANKKGIKTA